MNPEWLKSQLIKNAKSKQFPQFIILNTQPQNEEKLNKWVENLVRDYWTQVDQKQQPKTLIDDPDCLIFKPEVSLQGKIKNYLLEDFDELEKFLNWQSLDKKRRFVLVHQVEFITERIANKWLKTLEEPPKNLTIIWLKSSYQKLLSTLQSRAFIFDLNWIIDEENLNNSKNEHQLYLEKLFEHALSSHDFKHKDEALLLLKHYYNSQTFNQPESYGLEFLKNYVNPSQK